MEDKSILQEIRFAHEASEARQERANRRLWIAIIILIVLFFASNTIWLLTDYGYQETQTIEARQDGYGTNLVGGGDINYGADG